MSEHKVSLAWKLETEGFGYDEFNRNHMLTFENGLHVKNSAAAEFSGDHDALDPEQLLVASLMSCHMLTFLAYMSKKRYNVATYEDRGVGVLEKNEDGKMAVTKITLYPKATFSGERQPDAEEIARVHERSHGACFIAQSIKSEVVIEPVLD
ncbi:MAG: OsmC family protein [Myxococcales bacterium]|nr:OsmC family protein [Myxococcales bacterium]